MSDETDRIGLEASDWLVRMREAPDDREEAAAFRAWHDASPDHARIWQEMRAMFDLIGHIEPRHPDRLLPMKASFLSVKRQRGLALGIAAMAACVAIIVGPGLILRLQADHVTGAGHMEDVALQDGSHVHLGPDTAIKVAYSPRHRDIRLLKGQAWFEVAPDPSRPFQVRADTITATALGTAFDVRRIGGQSSVAVGHGRVRVEDEGARITSRHLLLAGDWIGIAADHTIRNGHQASDLAGIWQKGSVAIRGQSVAEAVEEVRPWFRGRIVMADSTVGRQQVTGLVRLSDPQEALRALVQPHGGQIVQITPWLIIIF